MSDGSNSSNPKILLEPLKSIGAQDLLKISYSHYGHLRKRGRRERLFGSAKWRQKFVVISQGCVYCFKDEFSDKPVSAFSLSIYNSVSETQLPGIMNCFEIKHEYDTSPSHFFCCETDERRKTWIEFLKEALQQAHNNIVDKCSADSDEGIAMMKPHSKPKGPLPPLPKPPDKPMGRKEPEKRYKPAKSEYDLEETDDEDEYDEVDTKNKSAPSKTTSKPTPGLPAGAKAVLPGMAGMNIRPTSNTRRSISERPRIPLPPTPTQSQAQLPYSAAKPPNNSLAKDEDTGEDYINLFPEEEYFLNSNDRQEAVRNLTGKPEGTFLVRNSSQGGRALIVQTNKGVKSFVVTDTDGRVTLNKIKFFPKIEALLCYYNKNDLPKSDYSVKLTHGYKFQF